MIRAVLMLTFALLGSAEASAQEILWTARECATLYKIEHNWVPDFSRHSVPGTALYTARQVPIDRTPGRAKSPAYTVLSPLSGEFVVGKPMLVKLELVNEGKFDVTYNAQQAHVNEPMFVVDPDGRLCAWTSGSAQPAGAVQTLRPGERVTILESYDVAADYVIREPGHYEIQFRRGLFHIQKPRDSVRQGGRRGFGPGMHAKFRLDPIYKAIQQTMPSRPAATDNVQFSNILRIEVAPGQPSMKDSLYLRVTRAEPRGWACSAVDSARLRLPQPPAAPYVHVSAAPRGGLLGDPRPRIDILVFREHVHFPGYLSNRDWHPLGKTEWGEAFLHANDLTREAWPEHRTKISEALGVGP